MHRLETSVLLLIYLSFGAAVGLPSSLRHIGREAAGAVDEVTASIVMLPKAHDYKGLLKIMVSHYNLPTYLMAWRGKPKCSDFKLRT